MQNSSYSSLAILLKCFRHVYHVQRIYVWFSPILLFICIFCGKVKLDRESTLCVQLYWQFYTSLFKIMQTYLLWNIKGFVWFLHKPLIKFYHFLFIMNQVCFLEAKLTGFSWTVVIHFETIQMFLLWSIKVLFMCVCCFCLYDPKRKLFVLHIVFPPYFHSGWEDAKHDKRYFLMILPWSHFFSDACSFHYIQLDQICATGGHSSLLLLSYSLVILLFSSGES